MAHNLLKNGHPLIVYDLSDKAIETIETHAKTLNLTAKRASSPYDVALQSHSIITMLPSSPHVRNVYTNSESGIFKAIRNSKNKYTLIDSSTIDPHTSKELGEEAYSLHHLMVDAPVSGGVGGASAGTLTFMVGCKEEDFQYIKPILQMMGKNIVYCGTNGSGQIAKVCNNVVLGMSMVAVAEGMSLGVKLGMDPKKLAGIFNTSSARCWSSDTYNPCPGVMDNVPSSRGYTGGFGTALMMKDMGLALDAAKAIKHYMPLANQAAEVYQDVIKQGQGGKDFSYVYEYLKEKKI